MWLLRPLPLLAAAVALCLAVAGGVTLLGDTGPVTQPATQPMTRSATRPANLRAPVVPALLRAVDVLGSWDRSRAAAYSSGDVAALRRLYVRGSTAGEEYVSMLREY